MYLSGISKPVSCFKYFGFFPFFLFTKTGELNHKQNFWAFVVFFSMFCKTRRQALSIIM